MSPHEQFQRYFSAALSHLAQCPAKQVSETVKAARKQLTLTKHQKIAELWKRDLTSSQIAAELDVSVLSVSSYVDNARQSLGHGALYRRKQCRKPRPGPLDQLNKPGDFIVIPQEQFKRHSNVLDSARIRGWKVSVTKTGEGWGVTALERVQSYRQIAKERAMARAARGFEDRE